MSNEYKILAVEGLANLGKLNQEIAALKNEGWVQSGPPVVSGSGAGGGSFSAYGSHLIVQAMEKESM